MAVRKRARSGRRLVNPRPNAGSARLKEQAEIDRLSTASTLIPRYSHRFQIFRQNRRQKRRQQLEPSSETTPTEHPSLRASKFSDLPISTRTLDGLAAANFHELTPIQKTAIPQALAGRDVLAAAPTGSGKTLAFLVPMLEMLWRNKWNTFDGLGALIISPTRELSMQIFDVLRSIGRRHSISAGLVIGGKDFEGEKLKVANMNVLVATPGRMLHHMDHVAELDCSNLKVLILDEADRILEMGFAKTLDAILDNLPKNRQTMLFSATQTKDIKSLARLSLHAPEYVAVHSRPAGRNDDDGAAEKDCPEEANGQTDSIKHVGTPSALVQSYAVIQAHEKLSVLWSFLKTHLKSKIIVFFASSKEVRFAFETFCKLRPGMSLLHIHGMMKQLRRTDMYDAFCKTKCAALFATDVASRGLDFPDVQWVVQVDCPDDARTYVHRVGRTARFRANGRAMLLLNEGKEERFLERLKERGLELSKMRINAGKMEGMDGKIGGVIASNQELKRLAQRAFMFYVKSVYQQSDKDVFDVNELDLGLLAKSYGLSGVPKVAFKGGSGGDGKVKERKKSVFGYRPREMEGEKKRKKDEKRQVEEDQDGSSEEEEELLTVRRRHDVVAADAGDVDEEGGGEVTMRKRKKRKLDLLGGLPSVNRVVFTEDGRAVRAAEVVESDSEPEAQHEGLEEYAAAVKERLMETADEDKLREKERVKAMHSKRKQKIRERNKVIRPEALAVDMQVEQMEQMEDESVSEEEESGAEDESGGEMEEEEVRESMRKAEQRALQILRARR